MPKDQEKRSALMTEKECGELETLLSELAAEGTLEFPVPQGLMEEQKTHILSDREQQLWAALQRGDQIRQRLKGARQSVFLSGMTFPQMIEKLRAHARLSVAEVAHAIHIQPEDLSAIEGGRSDPLQLSIETMANIIETFSLRLSVVEQTLKRFLAQRAMRAQMSAPSARTTGKIPLRVYERAFDDLASLLAEKDDALSHVALPDGYLVRLETALKRRGRDDLV